MQQALLFDYGGTLDTAARHWYYIIYEGYEHAGLQIPDEILRAAYVYGERYLATHPIITPEDDFHTLLKKKISIETDYLEQHHQAYLNHVINRDTLIHEVASYCNEYAIQCITHSGKILKILATRYPLYIVSNFYGNLNRVMEKYGISSYFQGVIESACVGVRKPSPQIFSLAVKETGLAPEHCIVIGDSYTKDIIPAAQIGCKTIWFQGEEWEKKQYDPKKPDYIIHSVDDLLDIL